MRHALPPALGGATARRACSSCPARWPARRRSRSRAATATCSARAARRRSRRAPVTRARMSAAALPADVGGLRRRAAPRPRRARPATAPPRRPRGPRSSCSRRSARDAWGQMVEPAAGGALRARVRGARRGRAARRRRAARLGRAPRGSSRRRRGRRALVVALLAAGVPGDFLSRAAGTSSAAGISQGLGTVPTCASRTTASTSGRGPSSRSAGPCWSRSRRCWPSSRGAAAGSASRSAAAIPLTTLYLVPVMQRDAAEPVLGRRAVHAPARAVSLARARRAARGGARGSGRGGRDRRGPRPRPGP